MATKRMPSAQRRTQIAEAALKQLAHDGQKALTLVELGRAVGISDVSVLRHFADKAAVVAAAVALFGELLDEDLPDDIEDPMRALGAFFVRRLHKVRDRPELMSLAYNTRLRDAADGDPAAVAAVDAHMARSAKFVRTRIEQAQAAGQMSREVPAQMWVWLVAGVLRGAAVSLPASLQDEDLAKLSPERTWEIVEKLLRGQLAPTTE